MISSAHLHTCAILNDGSVDCWGSNLFGEATVPDFGQDRTATSVTAGGHHTCAILDDGSVECWGRYFEGQTTVPDFGQDSTATSIHAGFYHTCVLLNEGSVECWGRDEYTCVYPSYGKHLCWLNCRSCGGFTVPDFGQSRPATSIAAGYSHTCAILDDGSVQCWGSHNAQGQTTVPDFGPDRSTASIAAGGFHTCAILDDGSVKCWGDNSFGQAPSVLDIGQDHTATNIFCGVFHTCAILDDGSVKCWGDNYRGQLGHPEGTVPSNHIIGDQEEEMGDNLPVTILPFTNPFDEDACEGTCTTYALCQNDGNDADCQCMRGFSGDGTLQCLDIDECLDEGMVSRCHYLADCENTIGSLACICQEGFVGDGVDCTGEAWGVRTVLLIPETRALAEFPIVVLKLEYAEILTQTSLFLNDSMVTGMPIVTGAPHFGQGSMVLDVFQEEEINTVTLIALFKEEEDAMNAASFFSSNGHSEELFFRLLGEDWTVLDGPDMSLWVAPTTSAPIQGNPTGLSVNRVYFEASCLNNGCWKVDVTYTAGTDNFNVFYIPKTDGDDSLSYDQNHDTVADPWTISPAETFLSANHPCTSADYKPATDPSFTPASVTVCCIPQLLAMYRAVETFEAAFSSDLQASIASNCGVADGGPRDRDITRGDIPIIAKRGQQVGNGVYVRPIAPVIEGIGGDLFELEEHGIFAQGQFEGLKSHINSTGSVEQYVGIHTATLSLDEVEVRTLAGRLSGTVGVEHTVDTLMGLLEFSATGTFVVDPFVTQVAIRLEPERTSFFTVATHGTNDYTFLQYVSMRLIEVYVEDKNNSETSLDGVAGSDQRTNRTIRTAHAAGALNYVQVTFTLGTQYDVDPREAVAEDTFPLIPRDSVRAGYGTFFDSPTELVQKCTDYTTYLEGGSFPGGWDDTLLLQPCAPRSSMCKSPRSIPDSFVSYNIPLGIDYAPFDNPSGTLSQNIFVNMVISAVELDPQDPNSRNPNAGGEPQQMKTTLTASIPVVEGGINIFCDGFTAKTDLKDVAQVDIVVGSAMMEPELSRLRILEDVASTALQPDDSPNVVNSDSIEAGLMTLVIKGNSSYFGGSLDTRGVTLELEDVITIHIMEDDGGGGGGTKDDIVSNLLGQDADDTSGSSGLITDAGTDSYNLNGAFKFVIDRDAQRAHLEPREALLNECLFNPARPDPSQTLLQTCVIRRDARFRQFPHRPGALSTAMEICRTLDGSFGCPALDAVASTEAKFMEIIFGSSDYAQKLGPAFANEIDRMYDLNDNYRRAYWINPAYEWTPTQTGGAPIFSVSQKLYLFVLVTMDENVVTGNNGNTLTSNTNKYSHRRRVLLQSTPSSADEALQDGQSSVGSQKFEFETSPAQMMAKAFDVPVDRVATFSLALRLTQTEACMSNTELQSSIRATMTDYLTGTASAFHNVQITTLSVDKADVQCSRRSGRLPLSSFSKATARMTMLVVFEEGQDSVINLAKLGRLAGIEGAEPLSVSPKVNTAPPEEYIPPLPSQKTAGKADRSSPTSSNTPLIAGASAVAAVVLIAAIGVLKFMRSKRDSGSDDMAAVQTINVDDLKRQLADDV